MNFRAILLGVFVAGASRVCLSARDAQAFYEPRKYSIAVDAHGVVHTERHAAVGTLPVWFKDCIRPVAPDYPYSARAAHQVGEGYFRLQVDLKTGAVTQIKVIRSTGFNTLDAAALAALRKWRWKPGKWREVDIPVLFKLERTPHVGPGSVRLPE
jgi:TonB family protein